MRRELERIEIPGEHPARERAWNVIQAAFADRLPVERTSRRLRPVLALAVVLAVVAAALSPPGRAVLDEIREAVGVERAQPLFSLPAEGSLLVVSAEGGGVWLVQDDGARRRLGDYEDAQWSVFGRFVVVTRRNLLRAITADGKERWSLSGTDVTEPRWGGTETDTRIAYLAKSGLRIVAGDGTDDRLLAPAEAGPHEWRPGSRHQLAYVSASELRLQDVDMRRMLWRTSIGPGRAVSLSWSADGERVLAVVELGTIHELIVFDAKGRETRRLRFPKAEIVAAAFAPVGRTIAVHLRDGRGGYNVWKASVRLVDLDRGAAARQVFAGQGDFGELAWSPNGRWLLLSWRTADQWLFVERASGRIVAVPEIATRFPRPDGRRPLLLVSGRWCCAR